MYYQEAKTIEFIQCLITFKETSQGRPNYIISDICIVTSLGRPQDVNFKHNTKHMTVVLFSILLTKCVARILKN